MHVIVARVWLPFQSFDSHCTVPFELLHSNIWGSSAVRMINRHCYYKHFTGNFRCFVWLFPLHRKSDALSIFISFKAQAENFFGFLIKALQMNGGGEYEKFPRLHGIAHHFSYPHTHAKNGLVECKHRHVVETWLTLMTQASLPTSFRVEAFKTATCLINRMPTLILTNSSPYEKLYKQLPNYSFLCVFGCACYPNLKPYNSNRL